MQPRGVKRRYLPSGLGSWALALLSPQGGERPQVQALSHGLSSLKHSATLEPGGLQGGGV